MGPNTPLVRGDQGGTAGDGREAGKMSEMNEKVEEPQEQAAERPALRDVSPNELKEILEAPPLFLTGSSRERPRIV